MPEFVYKVKKGPSEVLSGQMQAETEKAVAERLIDQGYFIVSIEKNKDSSNKIFSGSIAKISLREKVYFTERLLTYLDGDVDLLEALSSISVDTDSASLEIVINSLKKDVEKGMSLSAAMRVFPKVFDHLYVNLIRSGEKSGKLCGVLENILDFLRREDKFKTTVFNALVYPIFLFVVSALSIVVLIAFVVPRLTSVFAGLGRELPLATRILLSFSDNVFLFIFIVSLIVGIMFSVYHQSKRFFDVKSIKDKLILSVPQLGYLVKITSMVRFFRITNILLHNGVGMLETMSMSIDVLSNNELQKDAEALFEKIEQGRSFSVALEESKYFSKHLMSVIKVADKTGQIDRACAKVADELEKELNNKLLLFARLFEPAIILVVGVIVAFIVIAMILPVFSINVLL